MLTMFRRLHVCSSSGETIPQNYWRYDGLHDIITIIRAQIEFEDPAWRTYMYDDAYCDKVATNGSRKWSKIDPHSVQHFYWAHKKDGYLPTLR